jgi:hypothetical protein
MADTRMKVLRTYDGGAGLDEVLEAPETAGNNRTSLIYAGSTVNVKDQQRAVFLQQFGIAKVVTEDGEEGEELDASVYTEDQLAEMKQPDLRTVAQSLNISGYGRMTNDELRAEILAAQNPDANDAGTPPEDAPAGTHEPINTGETDPDADPDTDEDNTNE